jgi:hypothetical protein
VPEGVQALVDNSGGNWSARLFFVGARALVTLATNADATIVPKTISTTFAVDSQGHDAAHANLLASLAVGPENDQVVSLDSVYDQVRKGGWIVIDRRAASGSAIGTPVVTQIKDTKELTRTDYGLILKCTQATLAVPWLDVTKDDFSVIRQTTVYAQSEPLDLADAPVDPVAFPVGKKESAEGDTEIELDRLYDDLEPGRWLIVTGERTDTIYRDTTGEIRTSGVTGTELTRLDHAEHRATTTLSPGHDVHPLPGDKVHTFLILAKPLTYTYKRDTVSIYANVAEATHGQTCSGSGPPTGGDPPQEVLGSGDGSKTLQAFVLRQPPLTYVAAPTDTGTKSTLVVRVNGLRWDEAKSLVKLDGNAHRYVTRTDDDDKTTVQFGDGSQGARLPTGVENVTASYRFGIGRVGNVKAGQISLLATRPLGVKGVTNPLAATGGTDREGINEARDNTPRGLSFLGRLVSVPDYADFARASAGIGKARATGGSSDGRPAVRLVVAGSGDIPIDETSQLFLNLQQALQDYGDPSLAVLLSVRKRWALLIEARFSVGSEYLWDDVADAVRAALLGAFGFEKRDFGQPTYASEVIRVIQQVPGVAVVYLDRLDKITADVASGQAPDARQLVAIPIATAVLGGAAVAGIAGLAGIAGAVATLVPAVVTPAVPSLTGSQLPPVVPDWDTIAYLSSAVQSTLLLKVLPS